MAQPRRSGLWTNRDFMKIWAGESVSALGSEVSNIAIPLIGAIMLKASATQMGLLGTFQFAPFLLFGLLAGAWVDRLRRRPILIITNIMRALLLLSIPVTAYLHILRIEQLYVVGFFVGCMRLFFDVSYQSYLPSLVEKEELTDGNGKMEATNATASVLGPTIGGYLVQWFTAPVAVIVDALSFVWSAAWITSIKKVEPKHEPKEGRRAILKEIKEGVHFVVRSPLLRPIAMATGITNLFAQIMFTPYLLVLTRQMGLDAGQIGLLGGISSVGAILGALFGQKVGRRFGIGRTVLGSSMLSKLFLLLVPASLYLPHPMIWLAISGFFAQIMNPVYNINQVSLRQAYCPGPMQGRMNASMRTIVWGTIPIGAMLGGFLGDTLGYWPTMTLGAVAGVLGVVPLLFSQVPAVRSLTELPAAPAMGE